MKTVLPHYVETMVAATDARVSNYYGVQFADTKLKGFIAQEQRYGGHFQVRSPCGITFGNGWAGYDSFSLIGCIQALLESNHQVFEFNTFQELSEWLVRSKNDFS